MSKIGSGNGVCRSIWKRFQREDASRNPYRSKISYVNQNYTLDNNVDTSNCGLSPRPSGLGLVFLKSDGATSAIVIEGSNGDWPKEVDIDLNNGDVGCILLQMEIPQYVNEQVAEAALRAGIPVFQDIGGAERQLSDRFLSLCTYISPNFTELKRLTGMPVESDEEIVSAAKYLQSRGARNVLVTLGN